MNNSVAVLGMLFSAVIAYLEYLATDTDWTGFFLLFLFLSLSIGFVWFLSQGRSKSPSTSESVIASSWLWFRRVVSFSGAVLFLVGAVWFPIYGNPFRAGEHLTFLEGIVAILFILALAALCVWVGIFGQGVSPRDWRDDVALHHENRRRYHWRW